MCHVNFGCQVFTFEFGLTPHFAPVSEVLGVVNGPGCL